MSIIKITKQFSFEMAHALRNYDGLCRNIHGHSYKMDITLTGQPLHDENSPKNGMVMDFGDLKRLVNEEIISLLDHALVLNAKTDAQLVDVLKQNYEKIVTVDFQPTTENLLGFIAGKLQKRLPETVTLVCIRLRETDTSYAEWCEE
ncbi:MAG: 6-carboxytetrahydropterin synthase [Bacteroidales bacterium]|jgi:6-pyruvoyltetrahydropterin/6-carboxytetrahydropterin synthase|nr:6-carboxytetrahydropterin synthase [Bacteroidales bacterium]